jgi:hypothetical protein
MADCEVLAGCIFFNDKMEDYPFAAEQMKQQYCRGDSGECARHKVLEALGRESVPRDLYPHDVPRAERVIAGTDRRA